MKMTTLDFDVMKLNLDTHRWDYRKILPQIPGYMMRVLSSMDDKVDEMIKRRSERDVVWKGLVDQYYVEKTSAQDLTVSIKSADDRNRYLNCCNADISKLNEEVTKIEYDIKYHENTMRFLKNTQDICRNLSDIDKFRSGR